MSAENTADKFIQIYPMYLKWPNQSLSERHHFYKFMQYETKAFAISNYYWKFLQILL